MSEVEMRWTAENAAAVLAGTKTATIRRERHAHVGDYFQLEGHVFVFTAISSMRLADAAALYYPLLGAVDPPAVLANLECAYGEALDLNRVVYVHSWLGERGPHPKPRRDE